jgi:SAM-dependent methyltransferase
MPKKLLLCCGPTRPAGYVRLDSNPKHEPDILATIPPLPPEARGPWDVVELVHGIEHFLEWEVDDVIRECHAVLRPGGVFVLEQPNIEAAARVLLGLDPPQYKGVLESAYWPLFGDPAHRDPSYLHRWGWTPTTLPARLRAVASWSSIRVLPQQYHAYAMGRDFRVEAVK